jgi:hypothetical protein
VGRRDQEGDEATVQDRPDQDRSPGVRARDWWLFVMFGLGVVVVSTLVVVAAVLWWR